MITPEKLLLDDMLRTITIIFTLSYPFYLFADTELRLYRPMGETVLQAPIEIKESLSGECWQQSQRIKREDAWRCRAKDKIYDPCFVRQYGLSKEAICPQSPWIGSSIKLNLTSPVENSQNTQLNMAEANPWAIELRTGEKCQAIDPGEIYEGLAIRYFCDNRSVLLGEIQRCKSDWSILQKTDGGMLTAVVARAWF